jgi:putative ATPase
MSTNIPLAERMRPKSLDAYIGQKKLLNESASLRLAIDKGRIPSMILWGPPGVGKTSLVHLIAQHTNHTIYTISAISAGVKDVRDVIHQTENAGLFKGSGTILFIDEIHRFSKSQQDSLLNAVEKGTITLIGATTENPSFEVIPALMSRCQMYILESHSKDELNEILHRAIKKDEYLSRLNITLKETENLLRLSGGDARKLLNLLELTISMFNENEPIVITNSHVEKIAGQSISMYDKSGENHYDIASALIKSIRGSDPNAAVYWLARMIEGGENPSFIARRLLILASEDIGLANPNALILANSTFQSVQMIGWPESRIILSQCVLYLATSPKGNAAYQAINEAQALVKQTGDLNVPLHLRNAPTKLMKEIGYGKEYQYAHNFEGNFVTQEFMPQEISNKNFFHAGDSKKEQEIKQLISTLWENKYPI